MKKRALRKEFHREIRDSLQRFLSILLISALGAAFFAGLRACKTDMLLSADSFYKKTRMMDLRIVSTLGLTEEDLAAVRETDGVYAAEGAYVQDALVHCNDEEAVVRLYPVTEQINTYLVTEGRLPESVAECAMDETFLAARGYHIGDTIALESGDGLDLSGTLSETLVTIVGTVSTGRYMSAARGSGAIGNGRIAGYLVLSKENFIPDYFTELYVVFDGTKEFDSYSDEYDNQVEFRKKAIELVGEQRAKLRLDNVKEEAYSAIDQAKIEVEEKEQELFDAGQKISDGEKQIADGFLKISDARNQLKEQRELLPYIFAGDPTKLLQAQEELDQAKAELDAKEEELRQKENEIFLAKQQYESNLQDNRRQIEDAYKKIEKKREETAALALPKWYLLGRDTVESYVSFGQDADRMDAISLVFPGIFFLVAALVSLTTMTRMVDEERTKVGTLKALGYSTFDIAGKYIKYALYATFTGSVAGVLIGGKIFPYIVITTYKLVYTNLPDVVMPLHWYYSVLAILLSVSCTLVATAAACLKELKEQPAVLIRPAAPKSGKRIFLEQIEFFWRRLSFTKKASLRNMFRYKKRFFMTVVGIGCCMALLLVGFGLKDSIGEMAKIQYGELWLYDASISLDTKHEEAKQLLAEKGVKEASIVREASIDVSADGATKGATIIVLPDAESFQKFFNFRDRESEKEYIIDDHTIFLTEKLARMLKIKAGESVELVRDTSKRCKAVVGAVVENYIYHYIFITESYYHFLFGEEPEYNTCYLEFQDGVNGDTLAANFLKKYDSILSITVTETFQQKIDDMLQSLNVITYVLIICAGLLAFIVLYNLSNINITERRRELATLKVLGFYNSEVSGYVYRENVLLTLLGIVLGIVIGKILHGFVITTCEVDMVMFGHTVKFASYCYSSLLTVLFAAAVGVIMHFKLRRIDMIESLKSIE